MELVEVSGRALTSSFRDSKPSPAVPEDTPSSLTRKRSEVQFLLRPLPKALVTVPFHFSGAVRLAARFAES